MPQNSRNQPPKNGRRGLDDYEEVPEREARFYLHFPRGSLSATILADDGKRILMRAEAKRFPGDPDPGVGHAEEIRGEGMVNKTSAVENCETSAWGRALAALGYTGKKVASFEEVERAREAAAELDAGNGAPEPENASKPVSLPDKQTDTDASGSPENGAQKATEGEKPKPLSKAFVDKLRKELQTKSVAADKLKFALVEIGVDIDPNDADAIKDGIAKMTMSDLVALCDALGLSLEAITGTEAA